MRWYAEVAIGSHRGPEQKAAFRGDNGDALHCPKYMYNIGSTEPCLSHTKWTLGSIDEKRISGMEDVGRVCREMEPVQLIANVLATMPQVDRHQHDDFRSHDTAATQLEVKHAGVLDFKVAPGVETRNNAGLMEMQFRQSSPKNKTLSTSAKCNRDPIVHGNRRGPFEVTPHSRDRIGERVRGCWNVSGEKFLCTPIATRRPPGQEGKSMKIYLSSHFPSRMSLQKDGNQSE